MDTWTVKGTYEVQFEIKIKRPAGYVPPEWPAEYLDLTDMEIEDCYSPEHILWEVDGSLTIDDISKDE